MRPAKPCLHRSMTLFALAVTSCQANWVSPYNADLQKRATDMLSQVTAFELTLAETSDTSAADPAKPAVAERLAGWAGEVEAMAAIEDSIDPRSAACDKAIEAIAGPAVQAVEAQAASTGALAAGTAPFALKCESLPDIFASMRQELVQHIPHALGEQCRSGQAPSLFAQRCQFLFIPDPRKGPGERHGLLFSHLITDLDIIIFREGRQASGQASS
jgi:hypothetical protein